MESLPNYDNWKLASPDYDESDWVCSECGGDEYSVHYADLAGDEVYYRCQNCGHKDV